MYTVTNYGDRKRLGISQQAERLLVLRKDSDAWSLLPTGLCFVARCATFKTQICDVGSETGCTY